MPLPLDNAPWPPESVAAMYSKMSEWAAWYSGEPDRIIDVYAGAGGSSSSQSVTNIVPWWRFWSRARAWQDGYQRAQLHVPLASDLAGVSGALLFGESPRIRIRPAGPAKDTTEDEPGVAQSTETPEEKTERRLFDIVEGGDVYSRLVEAAESAAAIGGVYIYPVWDKELRDFPLMAVAQSDSAVPMFRFGFLTEVLFHRQVSGGSGNQILRHLELHSVEGEGAYRQAVVEHALYQGGASNVGVRIDLNGSPETVGLEPRVVIPGLKELDVEYVPNIRPNRLWRRSSHGVADIQGSESLLDALDETYASWMRDVRLAKARILVPRDYLRTDEDGNQAFDIDQEIYVPMDMEPGLSQDARAMLAHQFEIRYLQHQKTAEALIERIVSNAGYGQVLTSADDESRTGASVRVKDRRTLLTLRRKGNWWRTAIVNVLYRMLVIDNEVFGQKNALVRPTVETADSIIDSPMELASTVMALKTAESASIETRVRIVHPDWSEADVRAEVGRITGEIEAANPTSIGAGQFGDEDADPSSENNFPRSEPAKGPTTNPSGNQAQPKKENA